LIINHTIPVNFGIPEAFSDSDSLKAIAVERLEHILSKIIDALINWVVLDIQPCGRFGVLAFNSIIPDLLRCVDQGRAIVQISFSIQVKVGYVIT
jgi:hypothetical protein